jgi:PPM family protein phosphatase
MTKLMIRSAAVSDPGRVRGNNEDRVHKDDERGIYLVIDGVGGQAGGERAAAIAETELLARLERSTGTIEERIREGIALAGRRIFEQAQRNPEFAGMACVLTVAVLTDGEVVVGHVGDTRLYEIRRGTIAKLTRDHSPIGVREDAGEISEAEAMSHPRRNEIFRDVGSEERRPDDADFIETRRAAFEKDSALLLCSDGLTDQVSSSEIMQAVAEYAGDPGRVGRELIRRANEAGGKDNVSVVYVEGPEFAGTPKSSPAPKDEKRRRPAHGRLKFAAGVLGGILLGAAATFATLQYISTGTPPRRILTVAEDGKAEFPSIASALAAARPGDSIEVLPGVYRERLLMKDGVRITSRTAGQALLQPEADASRPDAAMVIQNVSSGSVSGFRIIGAPHNPISVGVLVADSAVELDGLEIEGTTSAGILIRGASTATVRAGYIHNNRGAGIVIEDRASPRIVASVIVNNGDMPESPRAGIEPAESARPVLEGNVFANAFQNLSRRLAPEAETELRKHNLFVEPSQKPKPRARPTEQRK